MLSVCGEYGDALERISESIVIEDSYYYDEPVFVPSWSKLSQLNGKDWDTLIETILVNFEPWNGMKIACSPNDYYYIPYNLDLFSAEKVKDCMWKSGWALEIAKGSCANESDRTYGSSSSTQSSSSAHSSYNSSPSTSASSY